MAFWNKCLIYKYHIHFKKISFLTQYYTSGFKTHLKYIAGALDKTILSFFMAHTKDNRWKVIVNEHLFIMDFSEWRERSKIIILWRVKSLSLLKNTGVTNL